ncbi:juvenile hormone epoxide hydrolase 1-like [Periplaneta americana]|uniref:juvenile hormone epoxide hydrolase 1-like n=1 Tax=Periplaneta americana TaxID=6978 RepID=UPI0037E7F49A
MGLLGKCLLISVALSAVGIAYLWSVLNEVPPQPQLDNKWWGVGQPRKMDESIRSFKINVPDEVLQDLKKRLDLAAPYTPPLEGINFEYGFNTNYLKKVIEFWKTSYNWRERETYLNRFPHFKTYVDGLDIHFIHVKPKNVDKSVRVLPLLIAHGWPGSIREFYDLIPLLTTPRKDADFVFEVVAPSLPGYGFSEGAARPGLGTAQIAVIMKNLMQRLGFNKFYVQGGDWGSAIITNMAILFPEHVLGAHSNMCFSMSLLSQLAQLFGSFCPKMLVEEHRVDKVYPLGKHYSQLIEESGYFHLQATKPDTIGVALRDSPVGLAAYILEKFSTWTNSSWKNLPDGGLTNKYKLEDLLDNVMIYWVTGSITTSMRIYSENYSKAHLALKLEKIPPTVPIACAAFPDDLIYSPKTLMKWRFPSLVRYTDMPHGGHFAAFEEPQLLAEDVWATIRIMEGK